jgi:hypothetical protein
MVNMVPAGTVLTYQAQITTNGAFQTPDDVIQQMNQVFAQSNIAMRDYHIDAGILDTILSPVNGKLQFQLTATLQTLADFGAIQDIQSIADHGVYMATDALPTSTVPNITFPGGTQSSTEQPGQAPAGAGITGIEDTIKKFISGITGTMMLIVLTILGVVLILASRTKSVSARGASFG